MNIKAIILIIIIILLFALTAKGDSAPPIPPLLSTAVGTESALNTAIAAAFTEIFTPSSTSAPTQTLAPDSTSTPLPTFTLTALPAFTATPLSAPSNATSTEALQPTPITSSANIEICEASIFVSDITIPDGTTLIPGKRFKKTWELLNTGTCAWKGDFSLVFIRGSSMSGKSTPINQFVKPGKTAKISVQMVAPAEAGLYTGYWALANSEGKAFGQEFYVQVLVVSEATPTP